MPKRSTIATMNPNQLVSAYGVYLEDARIVSEMQNWASAQRPVCHVAMSVGPATWAGGSELSTLGISFPAGSGFNERLRFRIEVAPEVQVISFGARAFMAAAGQEGQVRFTIGAAAAVTLTTFTSGTNGTEHTGTVATSSSGTGTLEVIIEINHSLGALTSNFLRDIRVEDAVIAEADLPDPADD